MKKLTLVLVGIVAFISCKRTEQEKPAFTNTEREVTNLVNNPHFISFAEQYLATFSQFSNYQRLMLGKQEKAFLNEMREAAQEPAIAEQIYRKYNVNFDEVINYQNDLDNVLLSLYIHVPNLAELPNGQVQEVLAKALKQGIHSDEPLWRNARERVNTGLNSAMQAKSKSLKVKNISLDEAWDCAVGAIGFNFGTQMTIGSIKKAGIKIITAAITKAAAKFAGPIGTAIMLAEFGFCMYGESLD